MVAKVMGNKSTRIEGTIAENDMEDEEDASSAGGSSKNGKGKGMKSEGGGDVDVDMVETASLKEENLEYFTTTYNANEDDNGSEHSVDVSR